MKSFSSLGRFLAVYGKGVAEKTSGTRKYGQGNLKEVARVSVCSKRRPFRTLPDIVKNPCETEFFFFFVRHKLKLFLLSFWNPFLLQRAEEPSEGVLKVAVLAALFFYFIYFLQLI